MTDLEYFKFSVDAAIDREKARYAKEGWTFSHDGYSYGMVFKAALAQTEDFDAHRFFRGYVTYIDQFPDRTPGMTAEDVAKSNLGYMAGYYDDATRTKIEKMYHAEHPIFGKKRPSAEEAFNLGKTLGQRLA
jgi:hypothetical protein